jgi:hypothetical protein
MKADIKFTSPRPTINVTQSDIDMAMPKESRHCMVALAIHRDVPSATHVLVDIQTIRWTDKAKGLRYTYMTPAKVIATMLAWDEAIKPAPFSFRLRGAQITTARPLVRETKTGTKKQKRIHKLGRRQRIIASGDKKKRMRATIVGGKPPPITRFAFQGRRVFGSRQLASLIGGRDLVTMLRGEKS